MKTFITSKFATNFSAYNTNAVLQLNKQKQFLVN